MNCTVFSENLKKFRLAKGLTQEQVAEILLVNAQTVSRWECGTTLPDVMMLPELARLYAVTVDDFYKKTSVAYDNYAQRLAAVFEKTKDPEDFMRCRAEFQKIMKQGELSTADKWQYAWIHHFMLRYCQKMALEWYDRAIADGFEEDSWAYRRARSLRIGLMQEVGRLHEVIREQEDKCYGAPQDAVEWICLLDAYFAAERYEDAYACFSKAIELFADNWILCIYGGDICEALKKYEEAFSWWDKAGELGTDFCEELYSKASCYDDLGEHQKAYNTYMALSEKLRTMQYDVEAEMAEKEAVRIKMTHHLE